MKKILFILLFAIKVQAQDTTKIPFFWIYFNDTVEVSSRTCKGISTKNFDTLSDGIQYHLSQKSRGNYLFTNEYQLFIPAVKTEYTVKGVKDYISVADHFVWFIQIIRKYELRNIKKSGRI